MQLSQDYSARSVPEGFWFEVNNQLGSDMPVEPIGTTVIRLSNGTTQTTTLQVADGTKARFTKISTYPATTEWLVAIS